MRRYALLGLMSWPTLLLLGGCSGLGKFFGDTITLPGANPNLPYGLNETSERAEGRLPAEQPILPQQGNVWPGPPQPLPTLNDVSRTSGNGLDMQGYGGGQDGGAEGSGNLGNGGSMSMGESNDVEHGVPTGNDSFSGGGTPLETSVPDASSQFRLKRNGAKSPPIVIPNGDGSSTVIEPDGQVKTIPANPK